jgi:hypothetical protein
MSEFSIEEKAKRYDEAVEKAKKFYNNEECRVGMTPIDLEVIFPELKEFSDKEIKKWLIEYFQQCKLDGIDEYSNGLKVNDIINWIEQQNELKDYNSIDPHFGKLINEIEPKFHVYDWVVTDKGDVVQIGAVNNGYYTLFNGMDFNMSYVDKCWHLWTNQDIKDGDILCTYECGRPKIIFILKGTPKKPYVLRYHCYYNIMYPYFESNSETGCLVVNDGDLKPATKEQLDTLFEKMKLEGYRWDEDKKKVIQFERFVRRKESNFDFEEDKNL